MQNDNLKFKMRGLATLEMLIAMALMVLIISSIVPLAFENQSVATSSQTTQEALYIAQTALEDARALAEQDFDLVNPAGPTQEGIYQKSLLVEPLDNGNFVKKVTSSLDWTGEYGNDLNVKLTTLLTNPSAALGRDTCNPVLSGDWTNPQILGYEDIPGAPDGASDIDVLNQKIYLTANPTAANQEDFYIFNVTDPTNPIEISGGGINTGPGLEGVHVVGRYAYVANSSTTNQLQVIDVSVPTAPVEILGARRDVTALGDVAVGRSIFYANQKVYLGLTKSDGPEFYVFDVTDPLSPTQLGTGFETNTLISQISVKYDIAYLATPDNFDTSTAIEHLRILDASDPTAIVQMNTYGESNTAIQDGKSLFYKDGTVYLGRASDDDTRDELIILDVNDPLSITRLGGKNIDQPPRAWSINAIILRSDLAFIITGDGPNSEFQIWNVADPLNINSYSIPLNITQASTGGMDCEGNLLYIAQRSNRALQIIGPGN